MSATVRQRPRPDPEPITLAEIIERLRTSGDALVSMWASKLVIDDGSRKPPAKARRVKAKKSIAK